MGLKSIANMAKGYFGSAKKVVTGAVEGATKKVAGSSAESKAIGENIARMVDTAGEKSVNGLEKVANKIDERVPGLVQDATNLVQNSSDIAKKLGGKTYEVGKAIYNSQGLRKIGNSIGSKLEKGVRYEHPISKFNSKTGKLDVESTGGFKMTALGAAGLVGVGMATSAKGVANDKYTSRMGRIEPETQTATPSYASYLDNGGATGDLAFALHRNRHG